MCTCTTLPNGSVIVCDECAAQTIEMLSEDGVYNIDLTNALLTSDEYYGIMGAVNDWLTDVHQGGQA